ncbi:ribonuclease H-like domain-containing protein [Tanacetum coccineum]
MQKTILKQQYKNFTASRSEGLDKTYDRFQKLISQLEIHGEVVSQEDANLKLLRSLPLAWNNIALIMRNKSDLDELSMDDLYNNLKVYEAEIKSQSSSSSNSQNVAFVSSDDTRSTNEAVNTAHDVPVARLKGQASSSTYADDVMFSFFVNQSNSPQLDNKDLEQIDTDDLEEMDLKWQVAMLTMRAEEDITNFALMAYTSQGLSSSSSSDSEVHTCSKDCLKSYETLQKQYDQQRDALKKSNLEIIGYQLGLESLEARIVIHQKNEAVYEEDIAFLKYDVKVRDNSITELKNQLAEALREKDDLKLKLEKFETSSMKLTKLINSQISVNNKSGVGFDSQMNENELHDCHLNKSEVFESASDSSVNEIEEENNQVNDRFKKVEGYHAVPPPYTGNYMPSRPDLSFAGLDDSVYKTNVSETITSVPRNESTASKSSKDSLEQPKDVRPSAPIIKEWESDSDDDCVVRPSFEQNKSSHIKINFVKSDENTRKSVIEQNTYRQAENLRKSQSPRVDKRNWNGLMTQKLGDDFEFNKKACFVCGSLNHLIKDCNFYENKMVGKAVLNNMGRVTGQREVRPVWNNAQRVNHKNKLTHPHPKRNFVPTAVATKSGLVPLMLLSKDTKINNVTAAGSKAVVNAIVGNGENVVKSLGCWIWRPTGKVIDHISKDSGSYMPKRFDYVDPTQADQTNSQRKNGDFKNRKNRTLIEAARTMLVDSLLPTTIWPEAVNTACYVQNRVLVTKSHNKTPYELLLGRPPSKSFMRPFGCLVTIFNTLDPLGKFDRKADEGFLVGYSISLKEKAVCSRNTYRNPLMLSNSPSLANTQTYDTNDAE